MADNQGSLKGLFGNNGQKTDKVDNGNVPMPVAAQNSKQADESYHDWGVRTAGQTNASDQALSAALQVVALQVKQEQAENMALQQKMKDDELNLIEKMKGELVGEKNKQESEERKLEERKRQRDEITNKIARIKGGQEEVSNRSAKTNFFIGLFIVVFITIYLFVFYSSAAYSAFFKEFGADNTALTETIFDANALGNAFHDSFFEGLFVLLLPVLFMGLGYIIYQFGKGDGASKYMKTGALYAITFCFDYLLAFLISKKIYDVMALTTLEAMPQYTMGMAVVDAGFWIIIFCGFIAYVIWGLVFGFTMKSYEEMDAVKGAVQMEEAKLAKVEEEISSLKSSILAIKNLIVKLDADIKAKETALTRLVQYDFTVIKQEINNFFTGWIAYMNLVGKPSEAHHKAESIKDAFIIDLDKASITNNNNII